MPVSLRRLLAWLPALACACTAVIGRAPSPPPPPPSVVDLELMSGERHTVPLTLANSSCDTAITYTVSTDTAWVRLPEPAEVAGLARGARGTLRVGLDLTGAAVGERQARLAVSCPTCPPSCQYPREVVLRVAVLSHRLPAVDLTLGLFHDLAVAGASERLREAHPAEVFAVLSAAVPGFQSYLRRLQREIGAQPRIRVLAAGEGTTAWPVRWPLAEAPPMLLRDGSVDVLVEFHPADDVRPARLPQPGAAQAPGPPPLLHYQVDPERWPQGGRVRHLLCSEPATLRRVVGKLTYGGGTADRREQAIDEERWADCPVPTRGDGVRAYHLEQTARGQAATRIVVASAYFLDNRTEAGPVIAVPLLVD